MSKTISEKRLALRTLALVVGVTVSVMLYLIGWPLFIDGVKEVFARYTDPVMVDYVKMIVGAAMIGVVPGAWIGQAYMSEWVSVEPSEEKPAFEDVSA